MSKKYNLFLLSQSIVIGFFILLMIHPSKHFSRIIGFILGFIVFYLSWRMLPSIAKKQVDFNKFSLFFLLSLFFPHYLLRDYHFVVLSFIVYYLIVYSFARYTDLSENIIMLFLIISISFSILHINMNHEYKETRLEKSLARTVEGPVRYRILMPELMNLSIAATGLGDMFGLMIIFRFASFALVLLSTYLLVMLFSNNYYLSVFLPLLYTFMMPFSWDVLYVTDFPEVLFSTLFIYNMFRKNHAWSSIFFILGILNKDPIVFNLVFFGAYTLLQAKSPIKNLLKTVKNNKKILLLLVSLLVISIVLKFAVISIYGKTWMSENQLNANLYSIKEYAARFEIFNFPDYTPGINRFFTFLAFSGGIYVLIILFFRKIPSRFLISFLLTFLLFIPLLFRIGTINETRILYFLYPYLMICLAYVFKDDLNPAPRLNNLPNF